VRARRQDDVATDAQGNLIIGISTRYRFAGAPVPPASPDNLDYYSYNAGPMHVIGLSSFFIGGTGPASPMTAWLKADLASVDRSVTPWVILITHAPMYNSNTAHTFDALGMLIDYEQIFLDGKVAVGFYGHVHAYER
jgi:hypothetical protein